MDSSVSPSAKTRPRHDGLPPERRRWATAALFAGLAMASLNTSIANIALPAISAGLQITPADAVWVVNIYQIAMVMTLLPFAALGDIAGHERIYFAGLILFTACSLACALSQSLPMLLVAVFLQGLGASGMMSVNTALVRFVYPERMWGRGFGHNALVVATAMSLGPAVGSMILAVAPWPWLFAINVPFGVIAIIVGLKTLPTTPRESHNFDLVGAILASSCLGLFIVGIGSAGHGGHPLVVAGEFAGALLFGWLSLRRQAGHPAPMLPIDLFKRPLFALSAATAVCSFATQGVAFVALPFFFEDVLHRSQIETGFLMTPWSLVVGMMALIAGPLSDRRHPGLLGGFGLVALGVGMVLLALLPANPSVPDILWRMVICGGGFGFFQSPNMKAIMSSAPAGRSGGASGIVATARLTGQTTGAAVAALCFTLAGSSGATLALAVGAGFATLGSALSFSRLMAKG